MRNFAIIYLVILVGASHLLYFFEPTTPALDLTLLEPSLSHWLGTDSLGRDLLYRILEGSRLSLLIGVSSAFLGLLFGSIFAITSASLGSWKDQVLMRFVEVAMALPSLILVSVLVLYFSNLFIVNTLTMQALVLILALMLTNWMLWARQVRNWVMAEEAKPYIEAAKSIGASKVRVLVRHILPNLRGNFLIFFGMQVPSALLFESFLSFVGMGIQPPHASWGSLLQEGWKNASAFPHLILAPGFVLFLTVLSFNILIDSRIKPLTSFENP